MTRREFEITDIEETDKILAEGKVIHLGLCDGDVPYVVPMNYGYTLENGKLTVYIHGARKGYKYDVIEKNNNVSFSVETEIIPFDGDVACKYGTSYKSVFGKGKAVIVSDPEEKAKGLSIIMKTQTGKDFEFNDKLVSVVNVVRIDVSEFTAKFRPLPKKS